MITVFSSMPFVFNVSTRLRIPSSTDLIARSALVLFWRRVVCCAAVSVGSARTHLGLSETSASLKFGRFGASGTGETTWRFAGVRGSWGAL